jgi:hypothetical protein
MKKLTTTNSVVFLSISILPRLENVAPTVTANIKSTNPLRLDINILSIKYEWIVGSGQQWNNENQNGFTHKYPYCFA